MNLPPYQVLNFSNKETKISKFLFPIKKFRVIMYYYARQ